jgi:hypothetical protein
MKLVKLHNSLGLVSSLLVMMAVTACGPSEQGDEQSGASTLNAFNVAGNATDVSVAELRSKKIGSVLASPESCRSFMARSMSVSLWAGYTDNENKWGKASAKCTVKNGGTYCDDAGMHFASNGGVTMGMEVPKVFELGSTAQYLCMAAGRALGLVAGAPRSKASGSDKVSVLHVANLKASMANQERSISDVYVISVTSVNSKTNMALEKKMYFTADGMPIGVRNSQAQGYNEDVQKQTAELHFLYPSTQNVLNEPRI